VPVVRVELSATRDEAKKIFALYQKGSKDRDSEERAIEEAWARGRTPTGELRFVGLTHGNPPDLMFDVSVHSDTDGG
jgi:hypothetical protein